MLLCGEEHVRTLEPPRCLRRLLVFHRSELPQVRRWAVVAHFQHEEICSLPLDGYIDIKELQCGDTIEVYCVAACCRTTSPKLAIGEISESF